MRHYLQYFDVLVYSGRYNRYSDELGNEENKSSDREDIVPE